MCATSCVPRYNHAEIARDLDVGRRDSDLHVNWGELVWKVDEMIGHERVWLMVTVLVEVLAQNEVSDTMSRRKCASVQPVVPVYDGSVKRRYTGQMLQRQSGPVQHSSSALFVFN